MPSRGAGGQRYYTDTDLALSIKPTYKSVGGKNYSVLHSVFHWAIGGLVPASGRDFLQKTTTEISQKYATIRIEDLNVSGMVANHKLSAAISDLGFYEFRRQLVYKQSHYGTKVEIVDRWYPSSKTCSCCGHIQPMPLRERIFDCQRCGIQIDRDLNASINLENAPEEKVGRASSELNACPEVGADTPRSDQEENPVDNYG